MRDGRVQLGRLLGIPIELHWSALVLGLLFNGTHLARWIAFLAIVLTHELGHAILVRGLGHHVDRIEVSGLGGACWWRGHATATEVALIAWGGVFAQALLYWASTAALAADLVPDGVPRGVAIGFLTTNVMIMALNLLPIEPLDGAAAWRLPGILWRAARSARGRARAEDEAAWRQRLGALEAAPPESLHAPDALEADEERPPEDAVFERILLGIERASKEAPSAKAWSPNPPGPSPGPAPSPKPAPPAETSSED